MTDPRGTVEEVRAARAGARNGTRQEERGHPPLESGFFQVDERELGDLLSFVRQVASHLHFITLDGTPEGDWGDLYLRDTLCVLGEIATLDTDALKGRFARSVALEDRASQALEARELTLTLDRWLQVLRRSDHPAPRALGVSLRGIIESELAPEVHTFGAYLHGEGGVPESVSGLGSLDRAWGVREPGAEGDPFPLSRLPARGRDLDRRLAAAGHTLLNATSYLAVQARDAFEEILRSEGNEPAIGLVTAFLELFIRSREGLNRFPQRRLEFYYRELLQMTPRPRTPDHAHLVLTPTAGAPPIPLEAGTLFTAGRDEGQEELLFATDHETVVTDAEVESLYALCYEQDPLISPESHFAFVTRITGGRGRHLELRTPAGGTIPAFPQNGPESPHSAEGVSLGFAVASPILALAEGTRRLRFDIELGAPPKVEMGSEMEAVDALGSMEDGAREAFAHQLGRLFSWRLLQAIPDGGGVEGSEWWSPEERQVIGEAARRILGEGVGARVEALLARDPTFAFLAFTQDALELRYTGESGWVRVPDVAIRRIPAAQGAAGLRVEVTLGPDLEPVIPHDPALHGDRHVGSDPVMSFRVNPGSVFYPFSLLEALPLLRIQVETRVEGVTRLVVHGGSGQLDPARPFQPFGAVPSRDSFLAVGSWEAAGKDLTDASLDIEWGELPDLPGGFRQHYFHYGTGITNESFRVQLSVLRDGRWTPIDREVRTTAPLFASEQGGRVAPRIRIPLQPIQLVMPVGPSTGPEDFASLTRARQSYFSLSLAGSEATFGHQEYPRLLTEVLTGNARRRRADPLPNPPYTPVVQRITMNYTARTTLRPRGALSGTQRTGPGRLLHEHAFGLEDITAAADDEVFSLIPSRPRTGGFGGVGSMREGYLFIGLSGTRIPGTLSLLFHLRHDAVGEAGGKDPGIRWFYLASNRWRVLDSSRVLRDSTDGFQRSGIVTLDVPAEINTRNTVLPEGMHWLAVGLDVGLPSLTARLFSVTPGGVQVTWQDRGNQRPAIEEGLPSGSISRPVSSIPGLGSVVQVGASFGGRPQEDDQGVVTRTAERLRHKMRAVAPWDYERLVLDRFPEVHQVKVFPNTDPDVQGPVPGRVLVVVVPRLFREDDAATLTPRFSGGELVRIRDYLQGLASGFVTLDVRNPVYEQVQVRCTLKLVAGLRAGYVVDEVNRALVDYLSPWTPSGYGTRFGWRIRREDIEGRIREIPEVEFVTRFSMLQITLDNRGRYRLDDTARPRSDSPSAPELSALPSTASDELWARYPWSLAIPTRRHFLATIPGDRAVSPEAEVTGVGDLELGVNFILDAGHRHG